MVNKFKCAPYVTGTRSVGLGLQSRPTAWVGVIVGLGVWLAGLVQAQPSPAPSTFQTALTAEPSAITATSLRFAIVGYEVSGSSGLSAEEIKQTLAPYTGDNKSADDVNAARAALQLALRRAGLPGLVSLPEQSAGGSLPIRLVVTPGDGMVLGSLTVSGASAAYSQANIQASLPGLQPGQPINELKLERNLRLANLNPGKRTHVELQPQLDGNNIDATVTVTTAAPLRGTVSLDNTGDAATGRARLLLGVSHSNITDHDDVLGAQFITSPSEPSKVQVLGLNYSMPLYSLNSQIEAWAAHANSKLGLVQNLFNISGQGTVAGLRWNYLLPATGAVSWKASAAYDWRKYNNDVTLAGGAAGSLLPNVTVNPLTLGVAAAAEQAFGGYGSVDASLSYSRNPTRGSSDAATFAAARFGAKPNYGAFKYSLGVTLRAQPSLASWGGRAQLSGQQSHDALVYGEQFGLGGMYSVRGYNEREFAVDSGYSLRSEIFSPNLVSMLPGSDAGSWVEDVRLKAFADIGDGKRNQPLPGETAQFKPASLGVGLAVLGQQDWSVLVDVARVNKTLGSRTKGNTRGHVSVTKGF